MQAELTVGKALLGVAGRALTHLAGASTAERAHFQPASWLVLFSHVSAAKYLLKVAQTARRRAALASRLAPACPDPQRIVTDARLGRFR